ncbi:Flavohemoprotein [Candida viswanathii]|uniref:nitric oxide dioxygenase n=1 Tax=Candida viswanathii TaxID=5486 RepID=A0A367XUV1_9ASCO|nr:Flavohemoprotein [Candida viswanathii]
MTDLFESKELTPRQVELILGSVPLLEHSGEVLIERFYQKFIKGNTQYFNMTHMKLKRQPKILAFAVLQYAKNIQDLTPLLGFVTKIVTKHVGLQVPPELYPVAGACLIESMVELLPPTIVDDEFVGAWTIAYGNLAKILIDLETAARAEKPWDGFKEFIVTRIERECEDVKSVYFTPADGSQIAMPKRGQYVSIRWKVPGIQETSREYSLSEYPKGNEYRISIRYIPGGRISSYVHNRLKVGDVLHVSPPNGVFTYEENPRKDVVILAGGIGITGLLAILEGALEEGRNVQLLYSNRTSDSRAFGKLLEDYKDQYRKQLQICEYFSRARATKPIGRFYKRSLTLQDLDFITSEHDVYAIGPRTYMKMIDDHLSGRDINVKLDYFGPPQV